MSDGSVNEIWNKALLAYNAGNINNAIGMLNTIAQADARLSFNLACLYIQKNNYSAALSLLKNALILDNSLSIAYFQRAYIRYHQGNFDSAYKNYAKTIVFMGDAPQVNFSSQGLDLTLFEQEVRANMEVVYRAKEMINKGYSDQKLQLYAIPQGLLFRPPPMAEPTVMKKKESLRKKSLKKGSLNIDTNAYIVPKLPLMTPLLLNDDIVLSPALASPGITTANAFQFTPVSPENIRIKVFWNSNDAMALLSHRFVILGDLVHQIRSRLQLSFDPTLTNHKTGQIISENSQLWDYLKDQSTNQFQLKIYESI